MLASDVASLLSQRDFPKFSRIYYKCSCCVLKAAIAMFGYMTEIDTVEMLEKQEITAEGTTVEIALTLCNVQIYT